MHTRRRISCICTICNLRLSTRSRREQARNDNKNQNYKSTSAFRTKFSNFKSINDILLPFSQNCFYIVICELLLCNQGNALFLTCLKNANFQVFVSKWRIFSYSYFYKPSGSLDNLHPPPPHTPNFARTWSIPRHPHENLKQKEVWTFYCVPGKRIFCLGFKIVQNLIFRFFQSSKQQMHTSKRAQPSDKADKVNLLTYDSIQRLL